MLFQLILLLFLFHFPLRANPTVHFFDVGFGDAIIIDNGSEEIIIDGGLYENILYDYAVKHKLIEDGQVELIVLTHPDPDHYRGLKRFFTEDSMEILEYWDPGYTSVENCPSGSEYLRFKELVHKTVGSERAKIPLQDHYQSALKCSEPGPALPVSPEESPVQDMTVKILYACNTPETVQDLKYWYAGTRCAYIRNNASIVLRIEIKGVSFLFTGDANGKLKTRDNTEDIEKLLLTHVPGELPVHVFKIPHHGSATASSLDFLKAVTKDRGPNEVYAILSAGTFPLLPNSETWERLNGFAAFKLMRTDKNTGRGNNNIVCRITGYGKVECEYRGD
jgi:beta-lactamase superfamily II metal-dependent hydrolase